MTSVRALLLVFAGYALVLAIWVQAAKDHDFSGVQEAKDTSTMKEYNQAKIEAVHAKLLKDALEEYQAHTNMVPDKKVEESIATALKAYHTKAQFPQEAGSTKVEVASTTPRSTRPFSTTAFPASTGAATLTGRKSDMACDNENALWPFGDPNNSGSSSPPPPPPYDPNYNYNNPPPPPPPPPYDPNYNYNNPPDQSSNYNGSPAKSPAQRVPVYQPRVLLFVLAFAFIQFQWTGEDPITH